MDSEVVLVMECGDCGEWEDECVCDEYDAGVRCQLCGYLNHDCECFRDGDFVEYDWP